jgi:hypothetical protein
MEIFSTNQRTSNTPARKKRVSTLDRHDLFFNEILSYLSARNKYIISSAERSIDVSMSKKNNKAELNRTIHYVLGRKLVAPIDTFLVCYL